MTIPEPIPVYTYAEICAFRGEKPTSGNTRIAQLKRWEREFKMEKVGRKFQIVEIYSPPKVTGMFRKGEQHLENSSRLLLDYLASFKDSGRFQRSEQFPEIIETLLYSVDIGEICGYLNENYRFIRDNNKEAATSLEVSRVALGLFSKLIGEEFGQTRRKLLESLKKKGVIYHYRKGLIGVKEGERPVALNDAQTAKFNLELAEYCEGVGRPVSTFGFSAGDWVAFHKRIKATGLGEFDNIFTGYYIAFTEKSITKGLEKAIKDDLKLENREFFAGKLMIKLTKWLENATIKVNRVCKSEVGFEERVIDSLKTVAELEKLINEFSGDKDGN